MADAVIILGSPSDQKWAQRIVEALDRFGITSEIHIGSAHKTPVHLLRMLSEREAQGGPHVYITIAGRSNALSGFVDAAVSAPVIACPPSSDSYGGMDILSSLRMPSGVAPLVILEPENAALAVAKILALARQELSEKVSQAQQSDRERVTAADAALQAEPQEVAR